MEKAIRRALKAADVSKSATSHTFRPSCAAHLLECGQDMRTIQELMSHEKHQYHNDLQ